MQNRIHNFLCLQLKLNPSLWFLSIRIPEIQISWVPELVSTSFTSSTLPLVLILNSTWDCNEFGGRLVLNHSMEVWQLIDFKVNKESFKVNKVKTHLSHCILDQDIPLPSPINYRSRKLLVETGISTSIFTSKNKFLLKFVQLSNIVTRLKWAMIHKNSCRYLLQAFDKVRP